MAWIRLAAGMRFGRLTVVEKTDQKDKWGKCYLWRCHCDCGKEKLVASTMLRNGNVRSCGCLQAESRENDLTGQRFGRLVALSPTGEVRGHSRIWHCQCDCGALCDVRGRSLADGSVRSCGCLQRETKAVQAVAMQAGCRRIDGTNLSVIGSKALYRSNSTGIRGVSWHQGTKMYVARITFRGKTYSLGYRHSAQEAAALRKAAEGEMFAPELERNPKK